MLCRDHELDMIDYMGDNGDDTRPCPYCEIYRLHKKVSGLLHSVNANKIKLVWNGFHHDMDIISPPVFADGLLIVHVTDESINQILKG